MIEGDNHKAFGLICSLRCIGKQSDVVIVSKRESAFVDKSKLLCVFLLKMILKPLVL